eukprot:1302190-Rhodomonas_salina.1
MSAASAPRDEKSVGGEGEGRAAVGGWNMTAVMHHKEEHTAVLAASTTVTKPPPQSSCCTNHKMLIARVIAILVAARGLQDRSRGSGGDRRGRSRARSQSAPATSS